jgi:hypothetical protein
MCVGVHHRIHRQLAPNCLHTATVFPMFSGSTSSGQGTYRELLVGDLLLSDTDGSILKLILYHCIMHDETLRIKLKYR